MHLILPAGALLKVGHAVHGDVRAVLMLKLQPRGLALGGGHVGVLVDDVLERVDYRAVGDEGQRIERVGEAVLRRVLAEELVHVRPREELHAHRVRLGGLHAAAADLEREAVVGDEVGVERVPGLVGHNVHVAGGAVEVRKDEGLLVQRELRAVAAAPLVLAGVDVEGVVVDHHVDELAGLLAHGVVHLARRGKDRGLAARGDGIAAGDDDVVIIELVVVDAEALGVFGAQTGYDGDDVHQHVLAEGLDLVLIVVDAPHAVVAQLDIVLVAHFLGHAVADVNHAVVDVVQLCAVLLEHLAEDFVCLATGLTVVALGVLHQHRARQSLAAELELKRSHELGVLADELVLLDQIVDYLRGHALAADLKVLEQHGGQALLQLVAERGIEQRGGVLNHVVLGLRADLVVIILLRDVELVDGIYRIAHVGERRGGSVIAEELEIILAGGENFVRALCVAGAGEHVVHDDLDLFNSYALIGKLGNLHVKNILS